MAKFDVDKIEKILVVQTAFLGDIILTIPLLNNIKNIFPEKKLYLLTTPLGKQIMYNQTSIDRIIVYDKKGRDKDKNGFYRVRDVLRKEKIDWAILPHRSFRSAYLVYKSRIKYRWGFSNSLGRVLFNRVIKYNKNKHDLERNLGFVSMFNSSLGKYIEFPIASKLEEKVKQIYSSMGFFGKKIIGINPESVWHTKMWPMEKYLKLIKKLELEGYKIVVFGTGKNTNISTMLEDSFNANDYSILNLIGRTNIHELIEYIRHLTVYVTNDSGPMHIAAALNIPIVAIFGPTTKDLGFFPYTDNCVILEKDLKCRPCGKHGHDRCPKKHFKCMNDISVDEVYNAIINLGEKND